jgi:hypothetical protein
MALSDSLEEATGLFGPDTASGSGRCVRCNIKWPTVISWVSLLFKSVHYYRLIYHYRHFHCHSDRSDGVIFAPLVGTIARPPRTKTGSSDFYHRWVNDKYGSGIMVAFPPSHEKLGQLGYAFCPSALK